MIAASPELFICSTMPVRHRVRPLPSPPLRLCVRITGTGSALNKLSGRIVLSAGFDSHTRRYRYFHIHRGWPPASRPPPGMGGKKIIQETTSTTHAPQLRVRTHGAGPITLGVWFGHVSGCGLKIVKTTTPSSEGGPAEDLWTGGARA